MMAKDPVRRYRKPIEAAQVPGAVHQAGVAGRKSGANGRPGRRGGVAPPFGPAGGAFPFRLRCGTAPRSSLGGGGGGGGAPRESKTEAIVPPTPRRAAPAPAPAGLQPCARCSSSGIVLAFLVVAGVLVLATAGVVGVVAVVFSSGPAPSTGPVSAPLPWTGPGPRPPGTGEPSLAVAPFDAAEAKRVAARRGPTTWACPWCGRWTWATG